MKEKIFAAFTTSYSWGSRVYYKNTYNINLFDYKIHRRYNVSTIPQYYYGYIRYCTSPPDDLLSWKMSRLKQMPTRGTLYRKKNQDIINNPNIFLRRTSSDNDSRATITDNSYASAAESVATVIYPPTPANG
ncbi:unnamed protein product [Rhizophagus irregularis]|nr:unnamed protein product [Rhizophagus irregularis]